MQTTSVAVRSHLFTVDEYHRMGEAGILCEDDRVELIEGELVDMAPIGSVHASVVAWIVALFSKTVPGKAIVFSQNPLRLGKRSEPQPDVMLLRPRKDFYRRALPTPKDVLLLIEGADTTVRYDREVKIPLYAQYDVPEVWLLDLNSEQVEIYRQPSRAGYRQILRPSTSEKIPLLLLPAIALRAADLLP